MSHMVSHGRMEPYSQLLAQFKPLLADSEQVQKSVPQSSGQLQTWLEALAYVVSQLDVQHTALVESILSLPWTKLDEGFVTAYIKFIGALVSARTEWAKSVLDRIVKGFKYRELLYLELVCYTAAT
jgi:RNA polymerase I-specific transcription initiation factor RRN3